MFSLTALLASLPPASLVETDLPRFVALALGRRTKAELPGLRALLVEESLRGYPPSVGPILLGAVEQLIARGIEPASLDARTCDLVLGSESFLTTLEQRLPLAFRRQRLRPGTAVTPAMRQTLGARLVILPGVGPQLVLVLPVDLAQVQDARFAMPTGPVLARPAGADEADALRTAWGAIEEAVGLAGPEAERWQARFFAIARRENHDAKTARDGLQGLSFEARVALWETIIQHCRDQELPEQHRPARRGLERRLAQLGLELELPWVQAVVALAESAYRAAGIDPEVAAGRPPCSREDVATWARWVDVPAAGRDKVVALDPAEIERLLVLIAEIDGGRVDRPFDEALRRPLLSLRDQVLRPRWTRSRWASSGLDPLLVAEGRMALGEDVGLIKREIEALADEARDDARRDRTRAPLSLPVPLAPVPLAPALVPEPTAPDEVTRATSATGAPAPPPKPPAPEPAPHRRASSCRPCRPRRRPGRARARARARTSRPCRASPCRCRCRSRRRARARRRRCAPRCRRRSTGRCQSAGPIVEPTGDPTAGPSAASSARPTAPRRAWRAPPPRRTW
ncbi:MAG: hypothetical protein U1F43_32670 [Myxococcota bacterium]